MRCLTLTLLFATFCTTAHANFKVPRASEDKSTPVVIMNQDRPSRHSLDQGGDACADALVIESLPFCDEGTTVGYTNDFENCSGVDPSLDPPDVTFKYTSPINQSVTVSACGSSFETQLTVWRVDANCNFLEFVSCDNSSGCTPNSCLSGLFFLAGQTYLIIVDGFENNTGDYRLHVVAGFTCESIPCGPHEPTGEDCSDPLVITSMPATFFGNTEDFAHNHTGCFGFGAPDVVFSYEPTTTHYADISTCNATYFNSSVYIFRDGAMGFTYACGERTCQTTDGPNTYDNAQLRCVLFEAGHDYCIVLDGLNSTDAGPFEILFNNSSGQTCELGDYCGEELVEAEPNDNCEQLDPHLLHEDETLYGSICQAGDEDYYLLAVPEDRWLRVRLSAGDNCTLSGTGIGLSLLNREHCLLEIPCNDCDWFATCGPETVVVRVAGLGECVVGKYKLEIDSAGREVPECFPLACESAPVLECDVPVEVNTCGGCDVLCKVYRDGCSGPRRDAGPQAFFRLPVEQAGEYSIYVVADVFDTFYDTQFSVFSDCLLPQTSCLLSQDLNNAFEEVTGGPGEENGTVYLEPGDYFVHVSIEGEFGCGDIEVTVTCPEFIPCSSIQTLTAVWNENASGVELNWVAEAGDQTIYSTINPAHDGDPRDGDPDWVLEDQIRVPDGPTTWLDTTPLQNLKHYVVLKECR